MRVKIGATLVIVLLLFTLLSLFTCVNAVPTYPKDPEPISDLSQIVEDRIPWFNRVPDPGDQKFRVSPDQVVATTGTEHSWCGPGIKAVTGIKGVYAKQEAQLNLELGAPPIFAPGRYLYAPTVTCPNKCPVEVVTYYERQWYFTGTKRSWCIYDFVAGGWTYETPFTYFVGPYVRSYPEGNFYFTEIRKSSGKWQIFLYNFNLQKWENKYNQASDFAERGDGWDIFEYWNWDSGWPSSFPTTDSRLLRVWNGSYYFDVDEPTYGWEYTQSDFRYHCYYVNRLHDWYAW